MQSVELADIDMNLLVVLDVLLEELHVTRAAKRLHRTQSAMSHALSRLRTQLNDPILIRVGGRMRPSPWAEQIQPELRRLLRSLEHVIQPPAPWEPLESKRRFTVVGPDFCAVVFPEILRRFSLEAPLASVELVQTSDSMLLDVAEGRHDVCFFRMVTPPQAVTCHSLAVHEHTVFMRRGHPALDDWGVDAWLRHPHIRIRMSGGKSPVDQSLDDAGLTRVGGPLLPHFMLAPAVLQNSDALFTVPYGVLSGMLDSYNLVAMPAPIPIPPIELALYFSRKLENEPASRWFREIVVSAFEQRMGEGAPLAEESS